MNIEITGISEDLQFGGYDVNLMVNNKPVHIWVNYSCTKFEIVRSRLIWYVTKSVRNRLLNALFNSTYVEMLRGNVSIKI